MCASQAIVLVNIGSPEEPSKEAVRSFLEAFLSDPKVVDLPALIWWPILHGPILMTRPAKIAERYRRIFLAEGSPLRVYMQRLVEALAKALADEAGLELRFAFRYGEPSIESLVQELARRHFEKLYFLPLYPQNSPACSESAILCLQKALQGLPEGALLRQPEALKLLPAFYQEPFYIESLAAQVRAHWQRQGRCQRLLLSFHGLPLRMQGYGSPYERQCKETARLLAQALDLPPQAYRLCYQSRFGPGAWLEPHLEDSLEHCLQEGIESIEVFCPGFVSDCLETLDEVAKKAQAFFLSKGGKRFHFIGCLNDESFWVAALAQNLRESIR